MKQRLGRPQLWACRRPRPENRIKTHEGEAMSEVINIHTDGACKNNPGPGGWAAVILTPVESNITLRGGDPETTNNRMELTATIRGLQGLDRLPETKGMPVTLHSDSKYLVDAFNQDWLGGWQKKAWKTSTGKPVKNRDLWEELLVLTMQRQVSWRWVKGHNGDYFNELCDRIATEEADLASREGGEKPGETQAGPPSGEPMEPSRTDTIRVLEMVFAAAAGAGSFEEFRETMSRIEKSIGWQSPYETSPQPWEKDDYSLPF